MRNDYFGYLNAQEYQFNMMCKQVDYKPVTTFWIDFSIADLYGEDAIKDTYNRAVKDCGDDIDYMSELTLVLNRKIWQLYETNPSMAKVYNELWAKHDDWCFDNFADNELQDYLRITD